MYRKSLISLVAFALYLALAFCACGCMLLIPQVNQYVGVGVGGGVCIVCALLTVIAHVREWSRVYLPVLICNGLGSGIAASSLFVFLKASPAATDTSCFSIAVVVIIVLLVVSQGEGLDGLDGSGLSSGGIYGDRRRKYNPYDFEL